MLTIIIMVMIKNMKVLQTVFIKLSDPSTCRQKELVSPCDCFEAAAKKIWLLLIGSPFFNIANQWLRCDGQVIFKCHLLCSVQNSLVWSCNLFVLRMKKTEECATKRVVGVEISCDNAVGK